jgi:hypothetical protein
LPDPNIFLYAYIRREAVLSSQIEGTQSTLADLLLFELEESSGVPFDDVAEVSGYVAALEHGVDRMRQGFPLSNRLMREMHAILISRGRGSEKSPGAMITRRENGNAHRCAVLGRGESDPQGGCLIIHWLRARRNSSNIIPAILLSPPHHSDVFHRRRASVICRMSTSVQHGCSGLLPAAQLWQSHLGICSTSCRRLSFNHVFFGLDFRLLIRLLRDPLTLST